MTARRVAFAAACAFFGCKGDPPAPAPTAPATSPPPATAAPKPLPSAAESPPSAVPSAAPAKRRRYSVAALGDSLTDPHSHGGKYLDALRKSCPESYFESWGKGGDMVNMMRRRFQAYVNTGETQRFTHLIVLGGINDICSDEKAKRTNDKIIADLTAIYAEAHRVGLAVIAMTLPPWGGFTAFYNPRRAASSFALSDWIREQAKTGAVDLLFETYPLLSCGEPEKMCDPYAVPDHVHWSAEGHRVIGEALAKTIFADCR